MQRVALGLLAAAAIAFIVFRRLEDDGTIYGYLRACAEAAMVGALADWFAVTALFRHPLGIPIPHTAIIPKRKAALGRTLGEFVEGNFLTPDAVAAKVGEAQIAARIGQWLQSAEHQAEVVERTAGGLRGILAQLDHEQIAESVGQAIETRLGRIDPGRSMAALLDAVLAGGQHRALYDAAAQGALRYLDTERSSLRQSLGEQSPWFVPAFVDDQVFDRLYTAVRTTLDSIVSDPSHPARDAIDAQLAELAARLRQPGPTRDRAAELQQRLVTHPQFREWSRGLWATVHADLDEGLASPNSDVRNAIAAAVAELATRLRDDEHTRRRLDTAIVEIARSVTERGGGEIGALIAETIDRWDPDEASRRIELAVGRDLQFIRINGTVVGGLAGLAIHAIGELVA